MLYTLKIYPLYGIYSRDLCNLHRQGVIQRGGGKGGPGSIPPPPPPPPPLLQNPVWQPDRCTCTSLYLYNYYESYSTCITVNIHAYIHCMNYSNFIDLLMLLVDNSLLHVASSYCTCTYTCSCVEWIHCISLLIISLFIGLSMYTQPEASPSCVRYPKAQGDGP